MHLSPSGEGIFCVRPDQGHFLWYLWGLSNYPASGSVFAFGANSNLCGRPFGSVLKTRESFSPRASLRPASGQPITAKPAPPTAAISTTAQGGVFHSIKSTRHSNASVSARRSVIAPLKTGA